MQVEISILVGLPFYNTYQKQTDIDESAAYVLQTNVCRSNDTLTVVLVGYYPAG